MATVEQIVKVQTNRKGALADIAGPILTSNTRDGTTLLNIHDSWLDAAGATAVVRQNTGLASDFVVRISDTEDATINSGALARVGTGATSLLRTSDTETGVGTLARNSAAVDGEQILRISDLVAAGVVTYDTVTNAIGRDSITLQDTHVFTTVALRNAADNIEWHIGDLAIVTSIGNFIYVGNNDFTGATENTDWEALTNVGGGVDWAVDGTEKIANGRLGVDAGHSPTQNPARSSQLGTFAADAAAPAILGELTYNSVTHTLVVNGTTIQTQGASASYVDTFAGAVKQYPATGFTKELASDPDLAVFPADGTFTVYLGGMKLISTRTGVPGDYAVTTTTVTRDTLTIAVSDADAIELNGRFLEVIINP